MGRNYERLNIEAFGAHLLATGDLDPIYIALHKMELPIDQLARWLCAYWCFYHAGVACHMSEQKDNFWQEMMVAAINEHPAPNGGRWPRGHERRHFRGAQGVAAIDSLRTHYPSGPESWIRNLTTHPLPSTPFTSISTWVQKERGFGPWISFKVGDMLDRLGLIHVDFTEAEVFMFKDPVEAALRLWRQKGGYAPNAMPKDRDAVITEVVAYLTERFKSFTAPPMHERPVGLQEVETILCKWKSHMNGHYPPQNDTIEIKQGLMDWRHSKTAMLMNGCMPEVIS